ncbi:MAG: hypothetical protein QF473_06635 [Planctomycetota bacterium]|jgi:hypothetical protein|nr:hypothetical protein [Planctomycetota bacterium]
MNSITSKVDSIRRREQLLRLLKAGARGAPAGTLLALLVIFAFKTPGIIIGTIIFLLFAAIPALLSFRLLDSRCATAKLIDDRLSLGDRISSALHFEPQDGPTKKPMVDLLLADARAACLKIDARQVLENDGAHRLFTLAVCFTAVLGASAWTLRPEPKSKAIDPTSSEVKFQTDKLARQQVELEALLELNADDQSDEVRQELERIRKLIQDLQKEGGDMTRKEILARLSREIKELEGSRHKGNIVLSKALEQLKVSKEAIARGDFLAEQAQMLDETHTDLIVRTDDGEIVGEAEKIKAAVMTDEERQEREALVKEVKDLAKAKGSKPGQDAEGIDWEATVEEVVIDGKGVRRIRKRKKVVRSYDDLMLAAGSKDIRQMLTNAAADDSRSTGDYKAVYTNFKRVLEEILPTKDMPIGQKEYVRRYFRLIRPKKVMRNP